MDNNNPRQGAVPRRQHPRPQRHRPNGQQLHNIGQGPAHDDGGGDRNNPRGNWRQHNIARVPAIVGERQLDDPRRGARADQQYARIQANQHREQAFNRQERPPGYHRRQNDQAGNAIRNDGQFNRNENAHGNARDDRNDNRRQNHNERCMGFRALEEIAHTDDKDIIVKVNEKKASFLNLLESVDDKGDIFVLIMQIIAKICQSSFVQIKLQLLLDICNSRFIGNLRNYLGDLPYMEIKARNRLYWNDQNAFWDNFLAFCQCIVDVSPSTALQKCRSLIEGTSKCCLESLNDRHGYSSAEEYKAKLNVLRERLIFCEKEEKQKVQTLQRSTGQNTGMADDDIVPPDDFRKLSVVPDREYLLDERPFLRANVVRGGYRDTEHYLDVQFRLLREDCFGPLREGITQFMKDPNKKKYDNIRVYHNVKFVEPYISKHKIGETIQLDERAMKRLKKINWAHSKRFIYGSLLILTKDDFKSFITATILDRDVKLLTRGKIPVSITDKVAGDNIYNDVSSYVMIESEVYFEPYVHVLKALQDPTFPEHIAMEKYIVRVNGEPNPPKYLTQDTVFTVNTEDIFRSKFRVLNELTWPTKEELGFNESQYDAYQLALTHEFAVIQGPPGTGKTFLGVKVARTLLENLSANNGACLLLVICYTNHALDQFLEAILQITDSIVRIGGQSRNEAMEKINLSTLRKNTKVDFNTKKLFFEQRNNLSTAVRDLQRAQERLDTLSNGLISYNSLKQHVPEVEVLGQFYAQNRNYVKTDPLRHWLFENMNYVDFNNVIREINPEIPNREEVNPADNIDEDDERIEFILDDFEDENGPEAIFNFAEDQQIDMTFSLSDIKNKLKTLIMLYNRTNNDRQKQKLQEEIIDLKSRADHFIEMVAHRNQTTRLYINNRTNLATVSMLNRWLLYFRWANVVMNRLKAHIQPLQETLDSVNTAYEEARMMVDLKIMTGIKVVGMTTSGAARLRKLLQTLAPSIVIVEEAAEVLEQHIVTSLTKSCQHLILIGDHQQLRPSAAYMRLARHYNLEVSLFERMITNGVHSRLLGVQHRMRPEIAALICPHIYQNLRNHSSVEQFPHVRGMTDNLFFFTHNYKEEEVDDTSSKSNEKEGDMTLKLANYLMQQGYEPGDITILAAYSGQMFYMRKQRDKYAFLSKVKITVVDNYQGEESKIILLSLVRNNDQNKIGFLGTENRVCVALSRAREGFYIFGNIKILQRNSELWTKIATTLEQKFSLGTTLMLKCETHSDQITTISSPKDFDKVPEGGCLLKCNYELPCGHRCPLVCHGYDRGHVNTKCFLPCERILCDLQHKCPLICSVNCQPCKQIVKKILPCGHQKLVSCYKDPADPSIKCQTMVNVILPKCKHEVQKPCHIKLEAVKCPVRCIYRVDKCGHECLRTCHVDDDPDHEKYLCEKPCAKAKRGCTAELIGDRGNHQCPKKCHEICDYCTVEVTKKRSKCKHAERIACNMNVDEIPCRKNCARVMQCSHFCKKKCYEPCGDCTQKVTKIIPECNHKITVTCMTKASRDLCREKCEKKLSCGHNCTQRCDKICDAKKCTQIIQVKYSSPCGHSVMLPCNVHTSITSMSADSKLETLLKYCTEPCGQVLSCDHKCGGTCGSCFQGRLHVACKEKCLRTQICGHQCNEPCNQVCPPCNRPCEIKCPHSRCNKLCGAPCEPCQEKCTRKCRHGACTRRCGEPCSRPPCDEPCEKTLPCGRDTDDRNHPCRGLCGEPCPDICKICRPDDFPRDFLGDEYDDDAKFVRLQDCTHVLDVENMDNLMTGDMEAITIRACPFCRTPIINTYRYKDIVNKMFKSEINPIKERVFGNDNIIKRRREELFLKVIAFSEEHQATLEGNPSFGEALTELHKVVKTQRKISLPMLQTQFQYLEILDMISECYQKYKSVANVKTLDADFSKHIQMLCVTLKVNMNKISQQLQEDFRSEIRRMNSIVQLAKILNHTSYLTSKSVPKVKEATEAAIQVVFSWTKYEQNKVVIALKHLEEIVKVSGIVTREERDLIVRAIGSKLGSWYKCPNGHLYTIGECGGAMQISKCADCGAPIGGQQHRLLSSNAHAGEVDGSQYAAWNDRYDNMANFNFND